MVHVELIYDSDCPNITEARAQLLRAFARVEIPPRWQESERGNSESPVYVRAYRSPTILINGEDVVDALPSTEGNCCRVYVDESGQLKRGSLFRGNLFSPVTDIKAMI